MAIQVPLNPQLQNATQLTQQIQNAVNAVKLNLGGAGGGRALNSLSQPLGRLTGQADEFTKSLDAANARVLAFGASVGVVNALTNAFKAMVNTTIMVEKTLADINVVFGKSSAEIKNFGKGIFDVAKQTGQSFEEVSKAALEFSRQGLTIEDTLARTKDALVLTRLTGLDTAKAVQGLTATINSFSKEALTSSEIINKLASVDQKFSVSAADLTEALSRSASVAQNAGVNFDELIGIITSLQERTARGGAVIGNSIKTIFTRIQRPEVLADLQNLGVAVENIQTGKLLSASEILKNLAGNIGALGQIQKSGIFEEVAGGFQINQLQALLTDLAGAQSTASKAQQVSTSATNEAYTANERLNQTISALINNSVEGLKELGATLGDLGISDSIKSALGVVNGFIESVQNLMEGDGPGAKFAQGIVKGIGSVLSGPGLALFGVIISKLIIDLGKFAVQGLKTFLGIGKAAAEQKALQEAIVITLSRNSNLQAQINKFQGNSVAQAAVLAGIYNQQEASLKRQASIAAGMASTLYGGGMRAGPQGFTQTGRRAAGGYLPSAEASDVSRGVGGASPSSRVVSIPNFAFGNGQRGTMVANTSEYIVPNFANGGSAIFNQEMVRSMGLPAGAQKIRAAGGYVPNFAKTPVNIGRGNYQKGGTIRVDASDIGMINISPKEMKNKASLLGSQIPKVKANHPNYLDTTFNLEGLQISDGLQKFRKQSTEDADLAEFGQDLNEYLTLPIVQFARDLFKDVPDMGIPKSTFLSDVEQELKKSKTSLLSKSAQGDIFEKSISLALMGFQDVSKESSIFTNSENSPFDFDPNGPASAEISKYFFGPKKIVKADAKRSNSSDARASFLKKMFNDSLTYGRINLPEVDELGDRKIKASKGYIPNFANQALTDSINRERVQSGLPISAISVTQDSRLMNSRNPTGLAVINSRDEPNGKIPNFAAPSPIDRSALVLPPSLAPKLQQFADLIDSLNKQIAKGKITQENATKELEKFVSGVSVGNRKLNPTKGKGLEAVQAGRSQLVNPEKVAQGFGDAAGKIFLLQTAVSFATGSFGDLDSATGKIVNKIAEASANITSLTIAGGELSSADLPGKFGKAVKGLGFLGIGAGIAYESFKLVDFAIKEYTGENEKAASALSKLETAAQSAAFSLEDLTPETQRIVQEQGKKSLESFKGSFITDLLGTSANQNPTIQKQAGQLAAQGLEGKDLESLLIGEVEKIVAKRYSSVEGGIFEKKSLENIKKEIAASGGGLQPLSKGATAADLSDALSNIFKNPEVAESGKKLAGIREGVRTGDISSTSNAQELTSQVFGSSATKEQEAIVASILQKNSAILVRQQASIDADKKLNLGKRLSLDIAKLEVDNAVELTRKNIERTTASEKDIELRMQAINLTDQEKITLESKLKAIELEKKLRLDILDIAKGGVDKALEGNINVTVDKLNEMKKVLEDTDLSKIDFSKPNADLTKLKDSLIAVSGIGKDQAQSVIDSIDKQINGKKTIYNFDVETNELLKNQAILVDEVKQKYESQLYAITRIAALAKSTADLNISGISSKKAVIGSQISTLEDANTNPYSGVLDKRANEKEILNLKLQQFQLDKQINAENRNAESIAVDKEIKAIEAEKLVIDPFDGSTQNATKLLNLQDALKRAKDRQAQLPNDINAENTALETNITLLEKRIALFDKRGTFKEGLSSGLQELENSTLDFQNTLGKEIPQLFSSNLAQGLNDAISGAKSLKEALTDAATSFFNAITQKNIQNLADRFTIGIGNIGKASGGMIKGGSGTKDDIPAMLMGGEYVLKKSAVQKYGSNFLDSLNKGKISGYAAGGGVQSGSNGFYVPGEYGQGAITGKKQLLDFATQSLTSGQFDQMGSYGMTGASINLEGESGRLTMAGRENSPMFERVQQAKEEAFQVYLESFKVDEQYQNQLKEIKDADKARKKKLMTSIAMAVATTAASAGAAGFSNAYGASAGQGFFSRIGSGLSGAIGKGGGTGKGGIGNLLSGNFSDAFKNLNVGIQKPTGYSSGISNTGGGRLFSGGKETVSSFPLTPEEIAKSNAIQSALFNSSRANNNRSLANGGPIFGGSGVRDDVPAMLTGGEFVLNNRATKKLGMSNLQRLNSGDTSSQQGSSDLTQALISKLDELISVTEKTGGDSVVVNVSGTEAQGEKTDGAKSSNERDLQRKIKAAVLEVITQEKRLGGSLNK